jgi:magnesium transporter
MRSTLHSPAPSSALLKFLKSQSEGVCSFSPNPRPGFIFDHAAPRVPQLGVRNSRASQKGATRCLSTTAPRRATVEAGFGNLEFLWPRSAALSLRPNQRSTTRNRTPLYESSLSTQRNSSTRSTWYQWRNKLRGTSAKKGGKPLHPDDLPISYEDDSAFSMGHRISAKAAAQPKLRCTELDEVGNVVLASGEFKKSELIAKVDQAYTFCELCINMLSSMGCYLAISGK